MICVQHEVFAHEVGLEVVHAPDRGVHLEEVRRVVFFVGVESSAGVGDGSEPSLVVLLGQDGPEATWFDAVPLRGVGDQGIWSIVSRVSHDWFGHQDALELLESLGGVWRKLAPFPLAVFTSELGQGGRDLCEVFDVCPEEVAKS